jgi:cell division protein FtsI/penicillin-binding protein 2
VARIEELQLPNVKIANYKIRYPDGEPAKQLIGFISQNPERVAGVFKEQLDKGWLQITSEIGAAGLEKTFEYWLQGNGATTISYFTDAGKRPLQGLNARLVTPDTAYYPLKIVTTLDKRVQQNIETFMKQMNITKGAAVVLDASNADVIAMASRPSYDPNHVDPEQGNWGNLALKAAAPGSIFKTVVAAAALDEGAAKPQETFDCEGALGKYGFTCWKKEGHGLITLEEAFAESCNITFAKVMERLTPKQLEAYARKMGLLSQVGWSGKAEGKELSQFDAEDAGQLFAKGTPSSDEGVLVQTAIGQRDVRMTPLQAANLVVTLLHKGEVLEPRVVKEIRMRNERVLETFPERSFVSPGDGISPQTAALLLRWMEEVVDHGTGTVLKHAEWSTAGKSGTAQVNNGPNPTVNQWFIGYAPVERPQYAIAVAVEDVPASEENRAVPLFKSIVNLLSGLAER